jgi:tight adherence protein C
MTQPLLWAMAVTGLVFMGAGLLLQRQLRRGARLSTRVRDVQRTVGIETVMARADGSQLALVRLVTGLGEAITRRGLLSAGTLAELERTLHAAGYRGRNVLGLFIGAKLLLLIGFPVVAWLLVRRTGWPPFVAMTAVFAGGVAGLLLPDQVIRLLHNRHLAAVERGLPDALDMLVICSEAGLGLEPAIERVGREIVIAHPAVAEEMHNVGREMRVNADRRTALLNLGARTGLVSVRRLGVTLVQTLEYGTPLSQALRTLSAEMRQEALTRFETRASRLPALLTVPMIVFILPCVFLIVGGPAIVHLVQLMRQ